MRGGGTARLALPVPRLAGPTTLLRPWSVEDAPALASAWGDPLIRRHLKVPEPCDEAAAARWISQRDRAWAEGRSVELAVTDKPSGTVIGEVGLSGLDPVRRAALIGWWIGEGWRGQGRAAEAVRLLLDWALSEGPLDAVMAEIASDNPASAAVARRAGMRRVDASGWAAEDSGDATVLVFARTRAGAGQAPQLPSRMSSRSIPPTSKTS